MVCGNRPPGSAFGADRRCFELTETSRDVVTSLMEMYLSMLNNRMAQAANETNLTVRRLTFITTIFMPLTLLAGIGGMSEWSMMTGPANWRIAYPLFMAGMVCWNWQLPSAQAA